MSLWRRRNGLDGPSLRARNITFHGQSVDMLVSASAKNDDNMSNIVNTMPPPEPRSRSIWYIADGVEMVDETVEVVAMAIESGGVAMKLLLVEGRVVVVDDDAVVDDGEEEDVVVVARATSDLDVASK